MSSVAATPPVPATTTPSPVGEPLCTWAGHTCGGCCNHFSRSREELARLFERRARLFAAHATDPEALLRFRRDLDELEGSQECKFLAFLDDSLKRVGCLIHPRRQGGAELRDAGPFGSGLCDYSFCPATAVFDPECVDPLLVLLARGADWYDYSRLFARYVFDGSESGLYRLLSAHTRPLAEAVIRHELRPERGLSLYGRLLGRLLGLSPSRAFQPEGIERLSEVATLPREALERAVEALNPAELRGK